VAAAAIAIVVSNESMFARGDGAAKIMPGLLAAASGIQPAGVTARRAAVCDPINTSGDIGVGTDVC